MNAGPGFSWRPAWACWLLLLFAALALAALVPAGPARAAVAVPVLFFVPGALTLGAVRARPSGDAAAFGGLAVMLSALWLAFAALLLNALHVRISGASVYVCLLLTCAVLAASTGISRRDPGERAPRGTWLAASAVVAGVALLAGGTFWYVRASQQPPAPYTWLAWSGAPSDGVIAVGPAGLTMPFQIRHQQSGTAAFRLTADWTGAAGQQHALAAPQTVRLGSDQTVEGKLTIPPPPGACAYRVVVTLTEADTAHPQTWSINADVRAGQPPRGDRGCAS